MLFGISELTQYVLLLDQQVKPNDRPDAVFQLKLEFPIDFVSFQIHFPFINVVVNGDYFTTDNTLVRMK